MLDKYTKFMLTIIAVGIIGINIHIFKGSVIEDAYAESQRSEEDIKQIIRSCQISTGTIFGNVIGASIHGTSTGHVILCY